MRVKWKPAVLIFALLAGLMGATPVFAAPPVNAQKATVLYTYDQALSKLGSSDAEAALGNTGIAGLSLCPGRGLCPHFAHIRNGTRAIEGDWNGCPLALALGVLLLTQMFGRRRGPPQARR